VTPGEVSRAGRAPGAGAGAGWAAWAVVAVLYGYSFFQRVVPSVLVEDLTSSFGVGLAAVGGLGGIFFLSMALAQLPIGTLLDRAGPRRIATAAALASVLGAVAFASAPGIVLAGAGRLLLGLAASVGFLGCLVVATRVLPPSRFGLASGLAASVGMAGALLGQAPLRAAADAIGWRASLLFSALLPLVLIVGCLLLLPRGGAPRTAAGAAGAPDHRRREVFRRWPVWACGVVSATLVLPVNVYAGLWAVPFLQEVRGFRPTLAALAASSMLVGFAVGSPALGWLAARTGRPRPILAGAFVTVLGVMALIVYGPGLPGWVVGCASFVAGVASGGMVLGFGLATTGIADHRRGLAFGMVNTVVLGTTGLAQQAVGAVLETTQTVLATTPTTAYRLGFGLLIAALVIGLVLLRAMPDPGGGSPDRGAADRGAADRGATGERSGDGSTGSDPEQ
jgi:predicted MFS family arabinose efflux permease